MHRLGFVILAAPGLAACSGEPEPECLPDEQVLVFEDNDNDGFGARIIGYRCSVQGGQATNNIDCDDNDRLVFPGAVEVCDDVDNNCDGSVDETFEPQTYYVDNDGDGAGDPDDTLRACDDPGEGYTLDNTDCDDARSDVSPFEVEDCDNGIDDDCNGIVDDPSETCNDGKDNNCDGLIDCEESACMNASACLLTCTDVAIPPELPVTYQGVTLSYDNTYAPTCSGSIFQTNSPDVVLLWTSPVTGTLRLDTLGSEFDTVLSVFRGECDGTPDVCNDDGPNGNTSVVTLDVQQGDQLSIVIDGTGSADRGNFTLNISEP
ncbi:MAG: putative metal-binding motif-containing protein [Myxococcota bacterium]